MERVTRAACLAALLITPFGTATPPPQRSLKIPPIIDPTRTAVLSGLVALQSKPDEKIPDGLRSVVWVVRPASMRTPSMEDQVMVLGAMAFTPATVVATPGTRIQLRGSERGVRVVKGSGVQRFERRLDRATASTPIVAERTGAIELIAEATREARESAGAIVIVDTPFAAVAHGDGAFRIVGLPTGRQQVRMRLADGKEFSQTVDLRAGGELVVDWRNIAQESGTKSKPKAPAAPEGAKPSPGAPATEPPGGQPSAPGTPQPSAPGTPAPPAGPPTSPSAPPSAPPAAPPAAPPSAPSSVPPG